MDFKFQSNIPKAKDAIKSAMKDSLKDIGQLVSAEAKLRAPVDTGELRKSIRYEVEDDKVNIGTDVEYGPHVEMGTSRQGAQPFLKDSFSDSSNKIVDIVAKLIQSKFN